MNKNTNKTSRASSNNKTANNNAKPRSKSEGKSEEIVEIIFAFIFAGIMFALWWFLYQKPLMQQQDNQKYNTSIEENKDNNLQVNSNGVSINATEKVKDENFQNNSQGDYLGYKNVKSVIFENKSIKMGLSLRGLKINNVILKGYSSSTKKIEKSSNKTDEQNLILISPSGDQYSDTNGFIDFGFGALNGIENGDIPNENSIWSIANANDVKFIAQYLPQNFDIGVLNQTQNTPNTSQDDKQKANFKNKSIDIAIKNKLDEGSVLFKWSGNGGLKFFVLINKASDENPYLFNVLSFVFNDTNKKFQFYSYGRINKTANQEQINSNSIVHQGLTAYTSQKLEEVSFKDIEKTGKTLIQTPTDPKTNQWLGFNTKYWFYGFYFDKLSVLNANGSLASELKGVENIRFLQDETEHEKNSGGNKTYQIDFVTKAIDLNKNQIFFMSSEIFLGAKKLDIISKPHYKKYKLFDRVIDFGIFYIFTKPMMIMLDFINKFIGNYGFSIILLTIFIKFLVYPLSAKSYLSMAKIKKLAPAIDKIKQKNKGKAKIIQQETAILYKTEGVNPASGCLPLLMQMPIFFAIYKILTISIELRHAPFVLWITDLSARDPSSVFNLFGLLPFVPPSFLMIGVLPILMGVSMFLQQKMTPKTDNPMFNTGILNWMPLILTFVFASFPSGLLIYWIVNNVFSVLQQLYFDKFSAKKIIFTTKINLD